MDETIIIFCGNLYKILLIYKGYFHQWLIYKNNAFNNLSVNSLKFSKISTIHIITLAVNNAKGNY